MVSSPRGGEAAMHRNDTEPFRHMMVSAFDNALCASRSHAHSMRNAIGAGALQEVMRFAVLCTAELSVSDIPPSKYYELYAVIVQELKEMQTYVADAKHPTKKLIELYESVQHAGSLVPRMYLAITVGVVCIQQGVFPAEETLLDLSYLCRGIQHPLRGIFARYYLLQSYQQHFASSKATQKQTSFDPSCPAGVPYYDFLYNNFDETVKLWIRFLCQFPPHDRVGIMASEKALSDLVYEHLNSMLQLPGMNVEFYVSKALPQLTSRISNIKDVITQEFLLQGILQFINFELLFGALKPLLQVVSGLDLRVNYVRLYKILFDLLRAHYESCGHSGDDKAAGSLASPESTANSTSASKDEKSNVREEPARAASSPESSTIEETRGRHPDSLSEFSDEGQSPARRLEIETDATCKAPGSVPLATKAKDEANMAKDEANMAKDEANMAKTSPGGVLTCDTPKEDATTDNKDIEVVYTTLRENMIQIITRSHATDYGIEFGSTQKHTLYRFNLTPVNLLKILGEFLDFTLKCHKGSLAAVAAIYELASPVIQVILDADHMRRIASAIEHSKGAQEGSCGAAAETHIDTKLLVDFMAAPLHYTGFVDLFDCSVYTHLLLMLSQKTGIKIYVSICKAIIQACQPIRESAIMSFLLKLLHFGIEKDNAADLTEAFGLTGTLIHLIPTDHNELAFSMICDIRNHMFEHYPDSVAHIISPLVFRSLELHAQIQESSRNIATNDPGLLSPSSKAVDTEAGSPSGLKKAVGTASPAGTSLSVPPELHSSPLRNDGQTCEKLSSKKILQFIHEMCVDVADKNPELCLRLFLVTTDAASTEQNNADIICNEFLKEALLCYEEYLAENRAKCQALRLLVSCYVSNKHIMSAEAAEIMAEKLTRHAAKLLRKSEQCTLILDCTHLFFNESVPEACDMVRVSECLHKCLKLAASSIEFSLKHIPLLIDVLEKYLYFFYRSSNDWPAETILKIIELCHDELNGIKQYEGETEEIRTAMNHFKGILVHIRRSQSLQQHQLPDLDVTPYLRHYQI